MAILAMERRTRRCPECRNPMVLVSIERNENWDEDQLSSCFYWYLYHCPRCNIYTLYARDEYSGEETFIGVLAESGSGEE